MCTTSSGTPRRRASPAAQRRARSLSGEPSAAAITGKVLIRVSSSVDSDLITPSSAHLPTAERGKRGESPGAFSTCRESGGCGAAPEPGVDHSRPGTARWCSKAACGNRMKARTHARKRHLG
ncbi:CGNR zinc finger domain-containing protein [Streptomyces sp. NPDC050610]|uniref:CGNR zinc finger domain-containing protein n=1 Tax=Streptomyces sp. NPDC050610 TaxID=3157097 RepID=UPI003444646B